MNRDKDVRIITCATNKELMQESYYRRLWLAVRNLGDFIPRRKILDELADCFLLYDAEGIITWSDGSPYALPDIDSVFGDDFRMNWFYMYVSADNTGEHPLRRTRKLERLRLFDLYFKIKYPHMAEKIAK